VPKLEAFKIEGLELKFNSLDHMAPHFHVKKPGGKWEIRVYFLTCTEDLLHIEYKRPPDPPSGFAGITKSERKELLQLVLQNRAQLLQEWENKVVVTENFNAGA